METVEADPSQYTFGIHTSVMKRKTNPPINQKGNGKGRKMML